MSDHYQEAMSGVQPGSHVRGPARKPCQGSSQEAVSGVQPGGYVRGSMLDAISGVKCPAMSVVCQGFRQASLLRIAWNMMTHDLIVLSFQVCKISSRIDGSDDGFLHCLKSGGFPAALMAQMMASFTVLTGGFPAALMAQMMASFTVLSLVDFQQH